MARRRGRPGDYLGTDDDTGFTVYFSQLRRDFWGNFTVSPLQRNLQEICSPLNDPTPVKPYRGPNYEVVDSTITTVQPTKVGTTNINTSHDNMAFAAGAVT